MEKLQKAKEKFSFFNLLTLRTVASLLAFSRGHGLILQQKEAVQ
jgi:hypothetical protein